MLNEEAVAVVLDAVVASAETGEIVRLVWVGPGADAARREVLSAEADDSAEHEDGGSEWWGDFEGAPWRVHLLARRPG